MLAMKDFSRKSIFKAIEACAEARMINLEAMAKERFAILLRKENEIEHSNEYLTSSYWLYQDWGAHAKALQLSQKYEFLKVRYFFMLFLHYFVQLLSFKAFMIWFP